MYDDSDKEIDRLGDYSQQLEADIALAKKSFAYLLEKLTGPEWVVERMSAFLAGMFTQINCNQKTFQLMACCMKYQDYLHTLHWQNVRKHVLKRWGESCCFCCSTVDLQVHHRTYKRLGRECWGDVVLLCGECHSVFHANRKAECQYEYEHKDIASIASCDKTQCNSEKRKRNDIKTTTRPARNI